MCLCCGTAFGMVLSSWPIFVLIPLVAWMALRRPGTITTLAGRTRRPESTRDAPTSKNAIPEAPPPRVYRARQWLIQTAAGTGVGLGVYLLTNPYVLINALFHREILESNLGNSFAMYQASRIGEGLVRVLELTMEGATPPVLVLGVAALIVAIVKRRAIAAPLIVTAGIFFCQFVMIGAGKPGEYGRFGIFPDAALAIGAACLLTAPIRHGRRVCRALGALTVLWCATGSFHYLANFHADTTPNASRLRARRALPPAAPPTGDHDPWAARHNNMGLIAEPAPYCCPPLPFDTLNVYLFPDRAAALKAQARDPARWLLLWTTDETDLPPQRPSISSKTRPSQGRGEDKAPVATPTPISWANKPIEVYGPVGPFAP